MFGRVNIGGGSNIKSIQRGTSTLTSDLTSLNVTISGVDLNKAILIVNMNPNSNNNDIREYFVMGILTSSTNIKFERGKAKQTVEIDWHVIEFNNAKKVQRGTVSDSSVPINVTINSVNMSKSILLVQSFFSNWQEAEAGSYFSQMPIPGRLTSATNILINIPYVRGRTFAWQVIEFE